MLEFKQVKRWWPSSVRPNRIVPGPEPPRAAYAKCQSGIPELGQTGRMLFFHILASYNHINQNRQTAFTGLGQTAVWPNTC